MIDNNTISIGGSGATIYVAMYTESNYYVKRLKS